MNWNLKLFDGQVTINAIYAFFHGNLKKSPPHRDTVQ